jgi:hypothetical protein
VTRPVVVRMGLSRRRLHHLGQHLQPASAATDLASATRPALKDDPRRGLSPVEWGVEDWQRLATSHAAEDIYHREVLAEVDRGAFLRDGYLVLPGVMTDPGRWSAALREAQGVNDAVVRNLGSPTRGEAIDWAGLGAAARPTVPLSEAEVIKAVGNSQSIPGASQSPNPAGVANGAHHLRLHSVLSECVPRATVAHIAYTTPQFALNLMCCLE